MDRHAARTSRPRAKLGLGRPALLTSLALGLATLRLRSEQGVHESHHLSLGLEEQPALASKRGTRRRRR